MLEAILVAPILVHLVPEIVAEKVGDGVNARTAETRTTVNFPLFLNFMFSDYLLGNFESIDSYFEIFI